MHVAPQQSLFKPSVSNVPSWYRTFDTSIELLISVSNVRYRYRTFDAGVTPTDVVNELALPSEPWTWVIGADGVVIDRFDGPVVPSLVRDAVERA